MPNSTENIHAQPMPAGLQTIDASEPAELKAALHSRLTDLVNGAPVMLFMKGVPKCPLCRFSRRIVRILDDRGIQYSSFDVLKDETVRLGIKEYADWPTFPQLWVNGGLVGGLDIVSTARCQGVFDVDNDDG
ncbi:probable glutaredoxin [Fusarium mangiferae]|uniref:Probable glutaredoxin n=1 Tax=Fusarium mangiferae TaxID=192010 RepID=A0A1L7T9A9_FUSMA|nr:putative glutaredoxin [Fusarium mangiferae]CVK91881.1 probable glutaredoxin [Fusarium mangiferae]